MEKMTQTVLGGTEDTFVYHIPQAMQRQYLRVPIQVNPDVETLTVRYDYARRRERQPQAGMVCRDEVNIVDLALEDAQGNLVGASGSERNEITVHENWATPGYAPTAPKPGQWHLVLGAYLIEPPGCALTITITQTPKQALWLRGDAHTHTHHSDGWYSPQQVIERARQDKLDYLFLTDHNSMASNAYAQSSADLAVLPGVEVTYYGGHYNLLGVARPIRSYVANTPQEVAAILQEGRAAGALASVNHPLDPFCPWTFGLGEEWPFDLWEVWNGPYTPANEAAMAKWHEMLCRGRRLAAIGGSDCHHSHLFLTFATPCTFLWSASRAKSDILAALRAGHAAIGMTPEAPRLMLQAEDAIMGDVCKPGVGGSLPQVRITAQDLADGDALGLITQDGAQHTVQPGACSRFEMAWQPPEGTRFVHAQVRRTLPVVGETLAAMTNPIYFNG